MRRAHARRRAAGALVLLLALAACTAEEPEQAEFTGTQVADDGGWTVLQYSMADNDLEPYMMTDLDELAAVEGGNGLAVTAYVDRAAGYSEDPVMGLENWEGAKVVDIAGGGATVVEELGAANTGDPAQLTEFIVDGIERHPNDNYALVVSDHGASWPGIGGDESAEGQDSLQLAELTDSIAAGLEQAGVEKLDFLGFDACLMASYEVASAVAPLADRMVASQELEPGHGWDYASFSVLNDGASAEELGNAVIEGYVAQAEASGTQDEITLSMIDLTQMAALDEAIDELAGAMAESASEVASAVGRGRANNLGFGRSPDPAEDTQMTDLGLLSTGISAAAPELEDQASAVAFALDDVVVSSVDSATTKGATGLSIYFPPIQDLSNADYLDVPGTESWSQFLLSYYEAGDAIPEGQRAALQEEPDGAEVFFDEDGANITGTFAEGTEDNLIGATISYGLVEDDGAITYFGEEPAAIADDGSGQALGIYDLTQLVMSDGEDEVTAYVALTYEDGDEVASIDVPMAYFAEGDQDGETYQDVLLTLTLDPDTGDVLSETYYSYDEELETYGELTADPAGIIVPEVLRLNADGTEEWTPTSDTGLFADLESIQYDLRPLESGTPIQLDLSVEDFGGNVATISAQVEVP